MGIKKLVAKALVSMDRAHRALTQPLVKRVYGETWEKIDGLWDEILDRALRGEDNKEKMGELTVLLLDLSTMIGESFKVDKWGIAWETPCTDDSYDIRVVQLNLPHKKKGMWRWMPPLVSFHVGNVEAPEEIPDWAGFEEAMAWCEDEEDEEPDVGDGGVTLRWDEREELQEAVRQDLLEWVAGGQRQAMSAPSPYFSHEKWIMPELAKWIMPHLMELQKELDENKRDFRWLLIPCSDGTWWIEVKYYG